MKLTKLKEKCDVCGKRQGIKEYWGFCEKCNEVKNKELDELVIKANDCKCEDLPLSFCKMCKRLYVTLPNGDKQQIPLYEHIVDIDKEPKDLI